jgi:hypothetical protein
MEPSYGDRTSSVSPDRLPHHCPPINRSIASTLSSDGHGADAPLAGV